MGRGGKARVEGVIPSEVTAPQTLRAEPPTRLLQHGDTSHPPLPDTKQSSEGLERHTSLYPLGVGENGEARRGNP